MSDPWRFIPLGEFVSPSEPAGEAVRTGLRMAWTNLRSWIARQPTEEPETAAPSLRSAPESFLDRLIPRPDWAAIGRPALDAVLKEWLAAADGEAGSKLLVASPHSGVHDMATAWAQHHGVEVLSPPSHGQLLYEPEIWLAGLEDHAGQRLLLAQMEQCYVRHQDGLKLLRGLLEAIRRHNPPWVLVCDSWAWTYLAHVAGAGAFLPPPLTLAPLHAAELAAWLRDLSRHRLLNPVNVRQTAPDRPILTLAGDVDGPDAPAGESPEFLSQLAAYSRGNPGVAWALWRYCLQVGEEEGLQNAEQSAAEPGYTVWVHPWGESKLPRMPSGSGLDEAFVAHSLLLHGGLDDAWLPRLLPMQVGAITAALARLHAAGLVSPADSIWRVTATGYPAVRAFLRGQALLIDAV